MDWRKFIDDHRFSLLEQPSPALCADRLDYFLRDLSFLKLSNGGTIRAALESLRVVEGRIAVQDMDIARWLAYTFIEADRTSWSNFREVGLYQVTAEAIKAAYRCELVKEADIWSSDEALWEILTSADYPEVRRWVDLITPGTRFTWSEEQPLFRVSTKVRSIDPPVTDGTSITPLSTLDPAFAQFRDEYLTTKRGWWPMGVVRAPG